MTENLLINNEYLQNLYLNSSNSDIESLYFKCEQLLELLALHAKRKERQKEIYL